MIKSGKQFYCLIIFSLIMRIALAQPATHTLRGQVLDRDDKKPVIGASVVLLDKDGRTVRGASTDIEGNYSLPVANPAYRVAVSYLGYKNTEPIVVGTKTVINFQLESSAKMLKDIVIRGRKTLDNGTGLTIDERDRTVSSFKVEAKDLEEMQAASIDQALQGRMPGVDIVAVSGDPGAPMQVRIRGTSTLNGNQDPLIIVDGMPYETTIPEDFNFATSDENGYGALLNIAPADIKDITVLKDAAATAVYGSRAANGVLVITTKRGTIGKPQISYTFKGSLSKQPKPIPTLSGDQYSTLILEEFYNAGRQFSINPNAKQFQYDKNDPLNFYNFSNNTNWIETITQRGYVQDHNLSIQGGGDKARYIASVNYLNNEGTTMGTAYNRIGSRVNLDYNVSKKITFRADFSYTYGSNDQPYASNLREVAYIKMPNQGVFEVTEYGNESGNLFSPASTAQGRFTVSSSGKISGTYNPLAMALMAKRNISDQRIVPKFQLRYSITPKLTATGDVQFDIYNQRTTEFLPQIATGLAFTDPLVNVARNSDADRFDITTKMNLIYNAVENEKHTLSGLLSFQTLDGRSSGQGLAVTNTASSYLQDPTDPGRTNLTNSAKYSMEEVGTIALVSQAQYKFLDRYIFSGSARLDGNSRFGPGNRYGLFPGGSFAWRINQEPFLRKVKQVDDLKLRLSLGQIGNAPRKNYTFYNTYQSYGVSYLGETGVVSNNVELTNLKWETKTSYNAGVDLALFKNKLTGSFDIYRDRITDLFYNDLQIASYNGYSDVDLNAGKMDNQGWEFTLGYNPIRTKKVRLDLSLNVAYNENVIREISRLAPRENKGKVTDNGVYKTYFQENNPFGSFYGYRYKGVYPDQASTVARDRHGDPIVAPNGQQVYMKIGGANVDYTFQPGDTMYEDVNFDGLIDYRDIVYLGNGNPKFNGGFFTTFTYKGNFRLSTNFTFRQGNDLINGTKISTTSMYNFDNQSTAVLRRWRKEGDITDIPRALYGTGFNYLASDKYVEDGSFIRLRSVTASYDFNKKMLTRLRLNSLKVYATAEGLFTITNYTGQDPEVGIRIRGINDVVMDKSTTPPLRTLTIGITSRF